MEQKKKYDVKHNFVWGYSNKRKAFKTQTVLFLLTVLLSIGFWTGVKRAAEVTAKDCLKIVFVPNPPTVRDDVFPTVGTK